jgi:hypothetical protein
MRHHILFLFLAFCAGKASAQQELMLESLPDVWHSTALNPSYFPENKHLVIGLPGYALDAAHSGSLTYNDVFKKSGGRTVIDFGSAIPKLDDQNSAFFEQRIETFSIGLRLPGNWMLQAGHANRYSGVLSYPKSLPELIWNGNAPYVGQTVNVSLKAQMFDWNEWSAGLSHSFGRFTIGVRVKYLAGISALQTDNNHNTATIYTDPDIYQLTLNTDYGFHSSSLISAIDTSGLGFNVKLANLKKKIFTSNPGMALDLGFTWKVSDKMTISASVLDLGGTIQWVEDAAYHLSQGNYTYSGVTFPGGSIINGTDSLNFKTKLDTLNDIFKFNKTPEKFTTKLPVRAYVNISYKLLPKWTIGVAYYTTQQQARTTSAVGASVRWQTMPWLSLGALYSVNQRSAANIGFHVVAKVGPAQVYFLSDNLLNAFSIKSAPAVNLRTGLSFMF